MTDRPDKHLFSFSDFNPSRGLSTTMGEPAVAGHIRWLKRRAQQLLPTDASPEFHSVCHEWWIEAFHDECVMQREAKWSPHARFDLEEAEDGDFPHFPSDTEPVILGAWLSHVLDSGEPNPQRKLRSRRGDGTRRRGSVRLHEMLATLALSELHQATILMVDAPRENAATVAALLMSASELMNRSEMHLRAESRVAEAGKSKPLVVSRKVTVGEKVEPRVPLKPYQARVTRLAGSLDFEFLGERCRVLRVTKKGSLTRGFSILLDLLLMPGQEVPLLTLDKSYRHQTSVPVGGKYAATVSFAEAKEAGLNVTGEHGLSEPSKDRMVELLESARAARAGGDEEKAEALVAEALKIDTKRTEERKKEAGKRQEVTNRPRLQSPETRDAIRNAGKRLADAVDRLEKEFPTLGKHLRAGIKGTKSERVRYDPHPHAEWIIEEVE